MPDYLRLKITGGTYFFTVVTYQRKSIFVENESRAILRYAWRDVQNRFPFTTEAICLLPDHIHCIWTLPEGDSNYSMRWKEIKRIFSREYQIKIGTLHTDNPSRKTRNETAIWQRRFWEHLIRDKEDLHNHFDYIHFNPVKHGLVKNVKDWPWSSFHRFVQSGLYHQDWGSNLESFVNSIYG